jgi:orotate phosphoribosyltransferase
MHDRALIHDLLKLHSVKIAGPGEPEFKLAAGGTSRFYIDVKKTALHRDAHWPLATLLYDELAQGTFGGIHAVAGVALGGCHLASIVGLYANIEGRTHLDVIYVRKDAKDHGTKALIEAPPLPAQEVRSGKTAVVLLEDVVTTGGSSIRAMHQLLEAGYDVRGTVAVIDRRAKAQREATLDGRPFKSLFTLSDFTADAP